MKEEQVIKGYDPEIIRRLMGYLKPYKLPVLLSIIALIISTIAELSIPLIIQSAVDENIQSYYVWYQEEAKEITLTGESTLEDKIVDLNRGFLIPVSELRLISNVLDESQRKELKHVDDEVLLIKVNENNRPLLLSLSNSPNVFFDFPESDTTATPEDVNRAVMTVTVFENLNDEDRALLRQDDIRILGDKALVFLAMLILVLVFSFIQIYTMAYAGQGVMKDLRMKLYSKTMNQRLGFLQDMPVGTLVSRLSNDVETINELFTSVLTSLIKDLALMAGVIGTLFILDTNLALYTVITLPPVLILTLIFRVKARDAFRNVRKWISGVNAFLSEHLSGMGIVQLFAKEKRSHEEFASQNNNLQKANLGEMYVFATFRPFVDLLSTVSVAVIIYFGAANFLRELISLGVLIAFINLVQRFYQPVMDMSEKFTILQSAMAGSERVFDLLDQDHHLDDTGKVGSGMTVRGDIGFSQVDFSYKEGEQILHKLSFDVKAGEKVAIVGYTGAGKTTIANVLTRLWDLSSGSITLDGIDIRKYSLTSLRSLIQPIQQDVQLFQANIRENLCLGREEDDQKLWEVLDQVQAADFIRQLPEGLDTELKENAGNLSTGQRQLLTFARILVQNPRVIIMDEATANIDTNTEQKIQKAIQVVMEGRTSLVIAHRLSTIRDADRILVLGNGSVLEQGTHEELINKQEGLYFNLYQVQYSEDARFSPASQ